MFSPDGKRIASASGDGTVRIRGTEAGEEVTTLMGHADGVVALTYSPDGKRIASVGEDRTIRLWDAEMGQEVLRLDPDTRDIHTVVFSPDGYRIAAGGDGRRDSGCGMLPPGMKADAQGSYRARPAVRV